MTDPDVKMKLALSELSPCAMCAGPVEYVMGSVRCRKCGMRGPFGSIRPHQAERWEEMQALLRAGRIAEKEREEMVERSSASTAEDAKAVAAVKGKRSGKGRS